MPSFKLLAAEASPAARPHTARPTATSAVVPYRLVLIVNPPVGRADHPPRLQPAGAQITRSIIWAMLSFIAARKKLNRVFVPLTKKDRLWGFRENVIFPRSIRANNAVSGALRSILTSRPSPAHVA
jgi:hypothetical protein